MVRLIPDDEVADIGIAAAKTDDGRAELRLRRERACVSASSM